MISGYNLKPARVQRRRQTFWILFLCLFSVWLRPSLMCSCWWFSVVFLSPAEPGPTLMLSRPRARTEESGHSPVTPDGRRSEEAKKDGLSLCCSLGIEGVFNHWPSAAAELTQQSGINWAVSVPPVSERPIDQRRSRFTCTNHERTTTREKISKAPNLFLTQKDSK